MVTGPPKALFPRAELQVRLRFEHTLRHAFSDGTTISGDLGDFASFVHHMKTLAEARSCLRVVTEYTAYSHVGKGC